MKNFFVYPFDPLASFTKVSDIMEDYPDWIMYNHAKPNSLQMAKFQRFFKPTTKLHNTLTSLFPKFQNIIYEELMLTNVSTKPHGLPPHVDNTTRRCLTLNFIIHTGGDDVTTTLFLIPREHHALLKIDNPCAMPYNVDHQFLVKSGEIRAKAGTWYAFNNGLYHSVDNITPGKSRNLFTIGIPGHYMEDLKNIYPNIIFQE